MDVATLHWKTRGNVRHYIITTSVHSAGFMDVASNHNLVVANDPSFTSLSFQEITADAKLVPLDLTCPTYEQSINYCCFDRDASRVAISVGSDSVFQWDVQTHLDIHCTHTTGAIHHLERCSSPGSWMGCMSNAIVLIDSRSDGCIPYPLSHPVTAFSQSISNQYILSLLFTLDLSR